VHDTVGVLRRIQTSRATERERGAALVEFAIVANLLFLIIFVMIEFGIAYNDYISVRQGTREAARLGVVNDLDGAPPCRIDGANVSPPEDPVTQASATQALICKAKDRIGLDGDSTKVRVEITGDAIGENLRICARFPVEALTGFSAPFISGKVLSSEVTMRLEQVPIYGEYSEQGASC
jgi:hypothetical protein